MLTFAIQRMTAFRLAAILAFGIANGCAVTGPSGQRPAEIPQAGTRAITSETVSVSIVETSNNSATWKFDPSTVTVRVGDTVFWTNTGGAAHTATAPDGTFDSGDLGPQFRSRAGGSFSWTPTAPGSVSYVCTYHPWMTGVIIVAAVG